MMRIKLFSIVIAAALLFLTGLYYLNLHAAQRAYMRLPTQVFELHQQAFHLKLATTEFVQRQGLGDLANLPINEGMYFVFAPPRQVVFWMKNMHFDLDILWLRHNQVVGIEANVPCLFYKHFWRPLPLYLSPGVVDGVVELNAGLSQKYNIRVGDRLNNSHPPISK